MSNDYAHRISQHQGIVEFTMVDGRKHVGRVVTCHSEGCAYVSDRFVFTIQDHSGRRVELDSPHVLKVELDA